MERHDIPPTPRNTSSPLILFQFCVSFGRNNRKRDRCIFILFFYLLMDLFCLRSFPKASAPMVRRLFPWNKSPGWSVNYTLPQSRYPIKQGVHHQVYSSCNTDFSQSKTACVICFTYQTTFWKVKHTWRNSGYSWERQVWCSLGL